MVKVMAHSASRGGTMATARDVAIAEENLIIDFQYMIQEMLNEKGCSYAELAKAAGISRARLSQIMGSNSNVTLRTVARLTRCLGEVVAVKRKSVQSNSSQENVDDGPIWSQISDAASEAVASEAVTLTGGMDAWFNTLRARAVDVRSDRSEQFGSNDNYAPVAEPELAGAA